jgi:hypothetical protein
MRSRRSPSGRLPNVFMNFLPARGACATCPDTRARERITEADMVGFNPSDRLDAASSSPQNLAP